MAARLAPVLHIGTRPLAPELRPYLRRPIQSAPLVCTLGVQRDRHFAGWLVTNETAADEHVVARLAAEQMEQGWRWRAKALVLIASERWDKTDLNRAGLVGSQVCVLDDIDQLLTVFADQLDEHVATRGPTWALADLAHEPLTEAEIDAAEIVIVAQRTIRLAAHVLRVPEPVIEERIRCTLAKHGLGWGDEDELRARCLDVWC